MTTHPFACSRLSECNSSLAQLSNLDSAVEGGAESAARAGIAEAPDDSELAVVKDEERAWIAVATDRPLTQAKRH